MAHSRKRAKPLRASLKKKKGNSNMASGRFNIHPFVVDIEGDHMKIYRTTNLYGDTVPMREVLSTPIKNAWIPDGGSPDHPSTNAQQRGRAILTYIKQNQYIYIGDGVLRILIKEPVLGFYSEVINNIPHSYIYTTKHVYIMDDRQVYPKSILLEPNAGIFSTANAGIEQRKEGLGKKIPMKGVLLKEYADDF
jgi:signal peptidase I